jgi:hypothetical protein
MTGKASPGPVGYKRKKINFIHNFPVKRKILFYKNLQKTFYSFGSIREDKHIISS